MVSFKCPKCKTVNRVDDEIAGTVAVCEECGRRIRVPSAPSPPSRTDEPEREEEETSAPNPKAKKRSRQDEDEREDDEPAPRRKKRKPASEDKPDDDEDRPRKRKKKRSKGGPLGAQKEVFGPHGGTLRIVAILSGALVIVALLMCILSQVTSIVPDDVAIPFAALIIPSGLFGLFWCLSFLSLKVSVHAGGLVYAHRASEREIPWEEIRYVWQAITEVHHSGGYVGTNYLYTIELEDRTQLKFANKQIHDVEKLGNLIIEKTSELILSQVRVEYQRGDAVGFGKLRVSQEGIHYGKQMLPWRDVKGVKIADGKISVNKGGKWLGWCSIPASSVPNLHVFLTFVNEMVRADSGGESE